MCEGYDCPKNKLFHESFMQNLNENTTINTREKKMFS